MIYLICCYEQFSAISKNLQALLHESFLQIVKADKRRCWVQVGVVSFGFGCAWIHNDFLFPGFYADVTKIHSWISNVCNLFQPL